MKRAFFNLFIGAGMLVVVSYGSMAFCHAIGEQFNIALMSKMTFKFFVKSYFGIYCMCELFSFIKRNSKSRKF